MRAVPPRTYPATRTPGLSRTERCAWCGIEVSQKRRDKAPTCTACRSYDIAFPDDAPRTDWKSLL